jgi:electron transfer flavoprotein-quinone oxidoreductase
MPPSITWSLYSLHLQLDLRQPMSDLDAASQVDVIVVGAGPAGAAAATVLARAGYSVILLERGTFPGSKNMYGGVVYPRILDQLHPEWWEDAPIQRWVTRRSTMVLTDTQALTVDFRSGSWGKPPYNGATAYRPDWDHWLAGKAEAEGAQLVCSTTATGLLRDSRGRVIGVTTDRPDGDLHARVVIACDGVNSFLAKEAGLYGEVDAANYTVGVKETIALPKEVIDERFAVRDREGVDIEILGGTSGVNGGGFVYTNLDTLAVGVVLKLTKLGAQQLRPEEIIANLKAHPAIAPLVEGGDVKEYSAHVIPEAGLSMMPKMTGDGLLVAGDAAAMCLAAGIWLEGVNFAMASGMYAGEAAAEALATGDPTAEGLAGYERRLNATFVLRDHRKLRRAPSLVLSDRVQHLYPDMIANTVERMFRVDNPAPKPGLLRVMNEERRRAGVKLKDLARDTIDGIRTFG